MKIMRYCIILASTATVFYSGFWFYQADLVEKGMIKGFTEMAKELGDGYELQYETTQKQGFPGDIQIALINPRLTQQDPENWSVHTSPGSKILGTFSPFGNLKQLALLGKSHIKVSRQDKLTPSEFVIDGNLVANIDSHGEFVESGSFVFTPYQFFALTAYTKAPIPQTGEILGHYSLKKTADDRRQLELDAQMACNQQIAFPEITQINTLDDLFSVIASTIQQKVGKSTLAFKASVDIPSLKTMRAIDDFSLTFAQKWPHVTLILDKFDYSDELHSFQSSGQLKILEDENSNVKIEFGAKIHSKNSLGYYETVQEALIRAHRMAVNWNPPEDLPFLKSFLSLPVDDLKNLIPKMYEFGILTLTSDLMFELNKTNLSWELKVNSLNLLSDIYGVSFQGEAKSVDAPLKWDFRLNIKNAPRLIDDIGNFYNHAIAVVNHMPDKKPNLSVLTPAGKQKILAYLSALSPESAMEPNDLSIHAMYKNGDLTVGTMNFIEFTTVTSNFFKVLQQEYTPLLLPPPAPFQR